MCTVGNLIKLNQMNLLNSTHNFMNYVMDFYNFVMKVMESFIFAGTIQRLVIRLALMAVLT